MKKKVEDLKVGDVIAPPAREVSLWMKRDAREKGLPESVLAITIETIYQGEPDKRGGWVCIAGYLPEAWYTTTGADNIRQPGKRYLFRFKARPATPWIVVQP